MENPFKTVRVSAGTRVYYFDAYRDRSGAPYISIAEIPASHNPGKRKRQRVFVHSEDIDKFSAAFAEIADHIKNDSER